MISSTTSADNNREQSGSRQQNVAIGTVCMALALASAVLLLRAVSLL